MEESKSPSEIVLGGQKFAPEGEALEFHISGVSEGTGKNFDTGEEEPRLVVDATLDSDVEGQGQQYRMWLKSSLHPKSTMAKLLLALLGEVKPATGAEIMGLPFQAILKRNETGTRQNFETFMKPSKTQKRVDVKPADKVLTDIDSPLDLDSIPF